MGLAPEEREIKRLIEEGKVRFILKREEVEITTPEEMEELAGSRKRRHNERFLL